MTARPWILAETTWAEVRGTAYSVAVLPWGATEAHNYHLPYATDNIQSDAVAAEAARRAWERGTKAIVLPCIPYGVNTGQLDIPLCINMNPSTQSAVLADICSALEGHGVRKLVIVNGHGGNDFKQIIRELQPRTAVFLSTINWYKVVDPKGHFADLGDHAGELETSVMQHIAADLVRPLSSAGDGAEKKSKLRGIREGWAWAPRQWTKVSADTGIGNPAAATAEKGARFFDLVCEQIAGYFTELAALDTAAPYA
ncbi:MAG: creatininase family protein [Gemmatimonadetes bacterium]|nr:creatininase family protein [Gemmatimonadota bacterium]